MTALICPFFLQVSGVLLPIRYLCEAVYIKATLGNCQLKMLHFTKLYNFINYKQSVNNT